MNDSPPEYDADQLIAPTPKRSSGILAPLVIVVAVILLVVAAFLGGYVVADDGDEVSSANDELVAAEDRIAEAEADREDALAAMEAKEQSLTRALERAYFDLRVVNTEYEEFRTFPRFTPSLGGYGEFESDFGWRAVPQRIGYLTLKPVAFERRDDVWVLTTRVTNNRRAPLMPFCGLGIAELAGRDGEIYRGEPMAGGRIITDERFRYSFCKELAPGETGLYEAGFQAPADADPAIVAISAIGALRNRERVWELP